MYNARGLHAIALDAKHPICRAGFVVGYVRQTAIETLREFDRRTLRHVRNLRNGVRELWGFGVRLGEGEAYYVAHPAARPQPPAGDREAA